MKPESTEIWDVIIVGAGPAGSSAAVLLARMRRKVLVIDSGNPRNKRSHGMHNFLSRDCMLPSDFLEIGHSEMARYGVTHVMDEVITAEKMGEHGFKLIDKSGAHYLSKRLLLATGVTDIIPDIPGMDSLWGKGVYHCPFCDGFELCDKKIGLYSRRYNGFGMAVALRQLSGSVILFTDGRGYLNAKQSGMLLALGIKIIQTKIRELSCSDDKLTCVGLVNGDSEPCDAVFVNNGHSVNNQLLKQLHARTTRKGAAVTNRSQECSIPGLYVAGDAAIDAHFVVVAASEGAKAAVAINSDLLRQENLF